MADNKSSDQITSQTLDYTHWRANSQANTLQRKTKRNTILELNFEWKKNKKHINKQLK